jgi:xylulokinase
MGFVIGVDVGSQSVKAVLCSPEGDTLATASHPCSMTHPRNGWSEQDPAQWRRGVAATVRDLLEQAAIKPADVSHIGVAAQVDGVVPVDRARRPVRDAIIWLDRRASAQAAEFEKVLGAETIFALSGLNPDASHIGPKLMWLRDHEPDVYRAAHLLPPVAGYLLGWLTGVVAQDHANASSTLLYDVRTRDWSPVLLDAAGIDASLLAPIAAAHAPVGRLTADAAAELGLTTNCVAVTGTGDDHGAALGAGVVGPGVIADVTGTAEPVAAATATAVFDGEHLVETHAHAVDGLFLIENPGFVSGGSTMWLADTLRASQADVLEWAGQAPAGAGGVNFVPALSGATAPRWNDRMRGAFHGLSMNHDRAHLCRAVVEGCVYALRDITDRLSAMGLAGGEMRVVGGGSRSPLWLQMKADVTGIEVRPVLDAEPTALGAAMLAAVCAGAFRNAAEASEQMTRLAENCYYPNSAEREAYDQSYRSYRRMFDALDGLTR